MFNTTLNSSLKTVQNCVHVVGVSFQQGHFSTGKDYEIRKKSSCRKMTRVLFQRILVSVFNVKKHSQINIQRLNITPGQFLTWVNVFRYTCK